MDYNETRIYGDQIDEFNLVFSKEFEIVDINNRFQRLFFCIYSSSENNFPFYDTDETIKDTIKFLKAYGDITATVVEIKEISKKNIYIFINAHQWKSTFNIKRFFYNFSFYSIKFAKSKSGFNNIFKIINSCIVSSDISEEKLPTSNIKNIAKDIKKVACNKEKIDQSHNLIGKNKKLIPNIINNNQNINNNINSTYNQSKKNISFFNQKYDKSCLKNNLLEKKEIYLNICNDNELTSSDVYKIYCFQYNFQFVIENTIYQFHIVNNKNKQLNSENMQLNTNLNNKMNNDNKSFNYDINDSLNDNEINDKYMEIQEIDIYDQSKISFKDDGLNNTNNDISFVENNYDNNKNILRPIVDLNSYLKNDNNLNNQIEFNPNNNNNDNNPDNQNIKDKNNDSDLIIDEMLSEDNKLKNINKTPNTMNNLEKFNNNNQKQNENSYNPFNNNIEGIINNNCIDKAINNNYISNPNNFNLNDYNQIENSSKNIIFNFSNETKQININIKNESKSEVRNVNEKDFCKELKFRLTSKSLNKNVKINNCESKINECTNKQNSIINTFNQIPTVNLEMIAGDHDKIILLNKKITNNKYNDQSSLDNKKTYIDLISTQEINQKSVESNSLQLKENKKQGISNSDVIKNKKNKGKKAKLTTTNTN